MKQYLDLVQHTLAHGVEKRDRTGTGTISVFGAQLRFDLADGFPLLTTKKMNIDSITSELVWFLEGSTDERRLAEIRWGTRHPAKKTIWTENAQNQGRALYGQDPSGMTAELGPIYGYQWRHWEKETKFINNRVSFSNSEGIDQIKDLVHKLKTNPDCRRMIVSAWNVSQIEHMALPPCHILFQCYVANDTLSLQVYQRSCDLFLGVPYNIASYAALLLVLAKEAGLHPGELIWTGGDVHLYNNHMEQVDEQLSRTPRNLPKLVIAPDACLDNLAMESFALFKYNPYPAIKAKMAV